MEERDQKLWRLAKKRVGFKNHLATYLIINGFLWGLWYFTDYSRGEFGVPWPVFTSLGWGIGLMFHFLGAYVFMDKHEQVEREYEKLKGKG
jgi:hypothetical protein